MTLTVREEIVNALCDGFGHENIFNVEIDEDKTYVHVTGFEFPVTVYTDDIDVPEEYGDLRAGIRLDVQAILSSLDAG